jgi:multicomponent Na+:H+ antiporter subunit G
MTETIGLYFVIVGLAFDVFGCIGLIRLPDVYLRLQSAAKCVTLGTCGIFFGLFLKSGLNPMGFKCLLIMFFILLTAPVSAHALSRAAHRSGIPVFTKNGRDDYKRDAA